MEHRQLRVSRPDELFAQVGAKALLAVLSDEERHRGSRLVHEADRRAYLAAHHLLRITLAPFLGLAPDALVLTRGHGGRPELAGPLGAEVSFNLSHTRGLVACAISVDGVVGVDVEVVRDLPDVDALARSALTPVELRELEGVPPVERSRAFLRRWTVKEAYAKATGHGLGLPLTVVSLRGADTATPTVLDGGTGAPVPGVRAEARTESDTHVLAVVELPREYAVPCPRDVFMNENQMLL